MKKVKNIGIIIIIIVLILIASGEGIYILKIKNKTISCNCEKPKNETVYKTHEYLIENINNELPDFIKINKQTIIEQMHDLIIDISTDKSIIDSKMIIEYYDENAELVEKEEYAIGLLLKENNFIISSSIPILTDKYSGKIKVSMETNDFDSVNYEGESLDKSKLNLNATGSINLANNELNINITGTNNFNQKISNLSGYVLIYDKDKIINIAFFSAENEIAVGENININTKTFIPTDDTTKNYDNLKVVINNLY